MEVVGLPSGAWLTEAAATPFHPDTVVLDVDGVLVDVEPSFREAVRHTVRVCGGKQLGRARPAAGTAAPASAASTATRKAVRAARGTGRPV